MRRIGFEANFTTVGQVDDLVVPVARDDDVAGEGHGQVVVQREPRVGVVVLDLTRFLSGPYCTLLLAGLLQAGSARAEPDDARVDRRQCWWQAVRR